MMDEMIFKKAAIDAAIEAADEWDGGCNPERQKMIEKAIMGLPAVNRWIPCSERLPEERGEYLVTYHPCYWDNVKTDIRVGIDSFRGKTAWAKHKHQRVIAWMPLPEPAKL